MVNHSITHIHNLWGTLVQFFEFWRFRLHLIISVQHLFVTLTADIAGKIKLHFVALLCFNMAIVSIVIEVQVTHAMFPSITTSTGF